MKNADLVLDQIKIKKAILNEHLRPSINEPDCPSEFKELITRCWDGNPNNRPDIDEIISVLSNLTQSFLPALKNERKKFSASLATTASGSKLNSLPISIPIPVTTDLLKDFAPLEKTRSQKSHNQVHCFFAFQNRILLGCFDGSLIIFDEFFNTVGEWTAHDDRIQSISVMRCNTSFSIWTIGADATLRIWELKSGNLIREWSLSSPEINQLTPLIHPIFSKICIYGKRQHSIAIWDSNVCFLLLLPLFLSFFFFYIPSPLLLCEILNNESLSFPFSFV